MKTEDAPKTPAGDERARTLGLAAGASKHDLPDGEVEGDSGVSYCRYPALPRRDHRPLGVEGAECSSHAGIAVNNSPANSKALGSHAANAHRFRTAEISDLFGEEFPVNFP